MNNVSNKLRNIMFAASEYLSYRTELLVNNVNNLTILLIFLWLKNIEKVETLLNFELKLLIEWFQVNLLSLNTVFKKQWYMIISKREILIPTYYAV